MWTGGQVPLPEQGLALVVWLIFKHLGCFLENSVTFLEPEVYGKDPKWQNSNSTRFGDGYHIRRVQLHIIYVICALVKKHQEFAQSVQEYIPKTYNDSN